MTPSQMKFLDVLLHDNIIGQHPDTHGFDVGEGHINFLHLGQVLGLQHLSEYGVSQFMYEAELKFR